MLADIQIPKKLLTPFHPLFHKYVSQPSLEQALRESRPGGRGKKRKASKKGGGKPFFLFCFDVSGWSLCRGFSDFSVWREH